MTLKERLEAWAKANPEKVNAMMTPLIRGLGRLAQIACAVKDRSLKPFEFKRPCLERQQYELLLALAASVEGRPTMWTRGWHTTEEKPGMDSSRFCVLGQGYLEWRLEDSKSDRWLRGRKPPLTSFWYGDEAANKWAERTFGKHTHMITTLNDTSKDAAECAQKVRAYVNETLDPRDQTWLAMNVAGSRVIERLRRWSEKGKARDAGAKQA